MNADSGGGAGRSWWQTLPGMITAVAGLITAITGLVIAIHQIWPSGTESGASNADGGQVLTGSATSESAGTGRSGARPFDVALPGGNHAQVGDLRYDFVNAGAAAGNPGQVVIELRVRMTNNLGYAANFWSHSFRLRAGADTSAPSNFLNDLVEGGTTGTGEVDFTVPSSVRRATLLVGDDYAKAVALPVLLRPK